MTAPSDRVEQPVPRLASGVPQLRTERLLLRGWRHSDLAVFAGMNADPSVTEFLGPPLEPAASNALVGRIQDGWERCGHGLWALEVLGSREFIGFVGLVEVPFEAPFTPAVEIGWRLARGAWGHGYATEAARAALRFAAGLGLGEVVSFTTVGNLRSRSVMSRLGMTRDATADFDHPRLPPGDPLRRHVLHRIDPGMYGQLPFGAAPTPS